MDEPYIRYKILLNVFCRELDSREIRIIRDEVAESTLVRTLLAEQQSDGHIDLPPHARWRGAHWVLYLLADLGHASGAKNLRPLAEQVYTWLLSSERAEPVGGSTEGHALYYLHFLALADDRVHALATRLADWAQRWKPGKTPASYAQGLAALRGLSMHVHCSGDATYQSTADPLAHTFLDLALYKRSAADQAISSDLFVTIDALGVLRAAGERF